MVILCTLGRWLKRAIQFVIMMLIASALMFFAFVNATGILSWQ